MDNEQIIADMREQLRTWDYDRATAERIAALLRIIDQQQAVIDAARHVNGCIRISSNQVVLLPGLTGALAYLREKLDALGQGTDDAG